MKKAIFTLLATLIITTPIKADAAESIPLEDIACWSFDAYGYPCFSLKDVGYQFDNPANTSYTEIMDEIEDASSETCGYEMYPNCGVVTEIGGGLITVIDSDGNLWQFMGTSDWEIGDLCSMIVSDEGTEEIYDDIVLSYEREV